MLFRTGGKGRSSKPDEGLLNEFRSEGDLEILGELYGRYMHLVYGVCLKYLKDKEESMDAVMQIFEKLSGGIPGPVNNFRNWLFVVTRNFCLMKLRSAKSEIEKYSEWQNSITVFMENEPELHPLDRDEIDNYDRLEDCIGRLNDEQRSSIRLFYFDNRCYNEIAAILKIDEKKVKSLLQNGKRNLKICLERSNDRQE